jgi:hypothetical protein
MWQQGKSSKMQWRRLFHLHEKFICTLLPNSLPLHSFMPIAVLFGRWNLTEEVWLESQDNACGICGRQCCPWVGFPAKILVFLRNYTNHASWWFIYHPGVSDGPIRSCSTTRYSRTPRQQWRKWKFGSQGLRHEATRETVSRPPLQWLHSADVTKCGTTGTDVWRKWEGNTDTALYSFRIHIVSWEYSSASRNHIVCYTCGQIGTFCPNTGVA